MKKVYNDGWHTIIGYKVYIENGMIVRGLSDDSQRPIYVYRKSRFGGYDKEDRITPDAFRAGVNRGTIIME